MPIIYYLLIILSSFGHTPFGQNISTMPYVFGHVHRHLAWSCAKQCFHSPPLQIMLHMFAKKFSKRLGILYKSKQKLQRNVLSKLYCLWIIPMIDYYCSPCYDGSRTFPPGHFPPTISPLSFPPPEYSPLIIFPL